MPWPPRSCRRRALVPTGQHTVWRPRIGLSGHGTPSGTPFGTGWAVGGSTAGVWSAGTTTGGAGSDPASSVAMATTASARRRPKCRSPAASRGAAGDRRRFGMAGLWVSLRLARPARPRSGDGRRGGIAEPWCRDVGHGNLPGFVSWRIHEKVVAVHGARSCCVGVAISATCPIEAAAASAAAATGCNG